MDKPKDLDEDDQAPTVEKLFAGSSFDQRRRSSGYAQSEQPPAVEASSNTTSTSDTPAARKTIPTTTTPSSTPDGTAPRIGDLPPGIPPPDGEKPGEYML